MDKYINLNKVDIKDAGFLYELMNNKIILDTMHENPTSREIWENVISYWEKNTDMDNYIIYEYDIPIGWIALKGLNSNDKVLYLQAIVLHPEKQNNGHGTAALKLIIKEMGKRKYNVIYLDTDLDNVKAQKCYSKCGFNICENLKASYSNGEENIDVVKMMLRL